MLDSWAAVSLGRLFASSAQSGVVYLGVMRAAHNISAHLLCFFRGKHGAKADHTVAFQYSVYDNGFPDRGICNGPRFAQIGQDAVSNRTGAVADEALALEV